MTPKLALVLLVASLQLALGVGTASASKHAVDFIGAPTKGERGGEFSGPEGVAVNDTGAGGVPAGTVYVADGGAFLDQSDSASRIQRFQREDPGTPGDTGDDTYQFVSAWGAGVLQPGSNYEICTVVPECRAGEKSGGNGSITGNGSLYIPSGIAVDQETGEVYVLDRLSRVNVYSAIGAFLRSYGWDVVESGPDDSGTAYEICRAAVDVCKGGVTGSGVGQIGGSVATPGRGIAVSPPDGDPASGTVYVADEINHRITTYHLDGSVPSSIGSAAEFSGSSLTTVAVDSRGIIYATTYRPQDNAPVIVRYDSQNVNGNGVGFLDPIIAGPPQKGELKAVALDPDGDGLGPDVDVLYASFGDGVQQYGPTNAPGLAVPPSGVDDTHAVGDPYFIEQNGLAVEPSTGRLYVRGFTLNTANGGGSGIYVLDNAGPPPTASLDSLSDPTSHSVVAHFTIDPNGPPTTSYHFEYSSDGTNWKSLPTTVVGTQEDPQSLSAMLEPLGSGFSPNSTYQVRLVAGRPLAIPIVTAPLSFTTLASAPLVETTGSPLRTTTTARLEGRVSPQGSDTTYHFEYGTEGPCDVNPCLETEPHSVGSSLFFKLVSQQLEGLEPATTYHYRVVADNGNAGSPVFGQDMTLSTRASDAPLSHGRFAGPPDSDRAYEQVSLPDTGGNPVVGAESVSDNGERVFYRVSGGTPISTTGTFLNTLFSQRTPTGWRSENNFPARDQLVANSWFAGGGRTDLADNIYFNLNNVTGAAAVWRVPPGVAPTKVFEAEQEGTLDPPLLVSEDASRVLGIMRGSLDPEHPVSTPKNANLYDITSGSPRLVGLMPDGSVPTCGSPKGEGHDIH